MITKVIGKVEMLKTRSASILSEWGMSNKNSKSSECN